MADFQNILATLLSPDNELRTRAEVSSSLYVRDGRTLCARVCFTVYTNTLDTTCVVCMKNLNITYA